MQIAQPRSQTSAATALADKNWAKVYGRKSRTNWARGLAATLKILTAVSVLGTAACTKQKPSRNSGSANPNPAIKAVPTEPSESNLDALIARKSDAAYRFAEVAKHPKPGPDQRAWAQFLKGTSHLLLGQKPEAKDSFAALATMTPEMKSVKLAVFLSRAGSDLAGDAVIPADKVPRLDRSNYEAIGYFVYALHDWTHGRDSDGLILMKSFRNSTPEAPDNWLQKLKPLANALIDERAFLQLARGSFSKGTPEAERRSMASKLASLGPTFASDAQAIMAPYKGELKSRQAALKNHPAPGVYRIVNKFTGQCFSLTESTNSTNAVVQREIQTGGTLNQQWELIDQPDGSVKLRSVLDRSTLMIPNATTQPAAGVVSSQSSGSADQWLLEPHGDSYYIRSTTTDQVLGVFAMSRDPETPIVQWNQPGTEDHNWRFVPVAALANRK